MLKCNSYNDNTASVREGNGWMGGYGTSYGDGPPAFGGTFQRCLTLFNKGDGHCFNLNHIDFLLDLSYNYPKELIQYWV